MNVVRVACLKPQVAFGCAAERAEVADELVLPAVATPHAEHVLAPHDKAARRAAGRFKVPVGFELATDVGF